MVTISDDEATWQGMAQLYGVPGMSDVCLRLQDGAGVSVSALLTVAWSARAGHGPLTVDAAAAVATVSEELERDVLRPYRRARNGLRDLAQQESEAATLRQGLLEQELALERFVQQRVLRVLRPVSGRGAPGDAGRDCRLAVARYLGAVPVGDSAELRTDLHQFFLALGDAAPDQAVSEALRPESAC